MSGASEPRSPLGLKAWMRARGAAVSLRDITSAAPRAFRSKASAEAALAALVDKGEVEQISEWPKVYRLVAPSSAREEAWPMDDVAAILRAEAKRLNDGKLPAPAVWLKTFKEVRRVLRQDPRLASRQHKPDRCLVCSAHGNLVDVKSGPNTVQMHLGQCFNRFCADMRGREDAIMLAAIQAYPWLGRLPKPNGGNQ